MHTQLELLDMAKDRAGLPSDYALAKVLGIKKQGISNFRGGRRIMADETAVELAHLCQLPPAYVLACLHYESAKCAPEKDAWKALATLAKGAAMALFLLAVLPVSYKADAAPSLSDSAFYKSMYYAQPAALFMLLFLLTVRERGSRICHIPLHASRRSRRVAAMPLTAHQPIKSGA